MRFYLLLVFTLLINIYSADAQRYKKEIRAHQKELNDQYADPERSPLTEEDRATFVEHPFYTIRRGYKIKADFQRTPDEKPFQMKTSGDKTPIYTLYGIATFLLKGETHTLHIYQNMKYKDHLFLPFNDLTNGENTYGGGRYVDVSIPTGKKIVIDFNKAYHPYCAYSDGWNCPIPPPENNLNTTIKAGIKLGDIRRH